MKLTTWMRWTTLSAVSLAASSAMAAEGEPCNADADCGDGEWCAYAPCAAPDCDPSDPDCTPIPCDPAGVCQTADDGGWGWEDECATDTDCGDGWVCEVVGGTGCAEPGCASPDGEDCPPPDPDGTECLPEVFYGCVPAPCDSDDDCGDGMECFTNTYEMCSGADMPPCMEGEPCPEPPEPECETVTESFCAPPWAGGCEADADCGEGFTCVEAESCWCSGGGGVPTPDGRPGDPGDGSSGSDSSGGSSDDAGDPTDPDDATDEECGCEPSGEFYCEPQEITCTTDSECPTDWTCETAPDAPTCWADSSGEEHCEEAGESVSYCMPPHWGDWAGGVPRGGDEIPLSSGGDEDDASTGEPGGDPPSPEADSSGAAGGAEEDSSGGRPTASGEEQVCSVAPRGASAGAWLLVALGALLTRRRRAA